MNCRVSGKLTHGQRKPREIGEPGNDGICSIKKGRGQDSMYFETCFIMEVAHASTLVLLTLLLLKLLDTLKVNVSVQRLVSLRHNSEPASHVSQLLSPLSQLTIPESCMICSISAPSSTQLPVDPV